MNEKIFESTKLAQPVITGDLWDNLFYMSVWDAFMAQSTYEWSRVFRDGTKKKFGVPSGGYAVLGRVNGLLAYCGSTGIVYPAFEINGLINHNEVLNPNWSLPYEHRPMVFSSGTSATFIDDDNQVYLSQYNTNRIDIFNLETGVKSGEIVHNTGERFASLSWVQNGQVAGMCKNSGKVLIMDYLSSSPRALSIGIIDPFRVGAYDHTYKLFFTIGTDNKTRVYSGDPLPNGLSNPVFVPAIVSGLKGNQVQVRFTGQAGEALSGWWVNWELEGVGGEILGSLAKYGSLTDANGYASNLYIGPDDGSTGQCKIIARVVLQ